MTELDALNSLAEFDCPFRVDEDSNVTTNLTGVWAPEVIEYLDDDGQSTGPPEISGGGWEFMDGYSGQDRYSGPVMHPSEFLGGRMARDVLATPGVYVVCEVVNPEDPDDLIGWVLLKRKDAT